MKALPPQFHRTGGSTVFFDAVMEEVEKLNSAGTRIEGLARQYPRAANELIAIAHGVRNNATILAVLAAAKNKGS